MKFCYSLDYEPRGYAHLQNNTITFFLSSFSRIPFGIESCPFENIGELIEELMIHELIHKITSEKSEEKVDGWHTLYCRLMSGRKECNCPIDCFWRDVYS